MLFLLYRNLLLVEKDRKKQIKKNFQQRMTKNNNFILEREVNSIIAASLYCHKYDCSLTVKYLQTSYSQFLHPWCPPNTDSPTTGHGPVIRRSRCKLRSINRYSRSHVVRCTYTKLYNRNLHQVISKDSSSVGRVKSCVDLIEIQSNFPK